jgi:DNA polymerase-3 subunit epsilon
MEQWWSEETHKRRRRARSEEAYTWLLPFVPLDIAKLERLQAAQEWGPHGASGLAKSLRALIRERRKAKEPHQDLLMALYGSCLAADLSESLRFEGYPPHYMAQFVDINELNLIHIDYASMGYQCIKALSKTDVKWLVETFGDPAEHQSFEALWPNIRCNAVSRHCWDKLRRSNETSRSLGRPQKTMQEWLNELVGRNIGYHKEWQERVAARQAYIAEASQAFDAAWAATDQSFIVADLETTGLNAETDEVLELAAIKVKRSGIVEDEFACLVRTTKPVSKMITGLTGITQEDIACEGSPLAEAMKAFIAFVGVQPVFFHNAPFDQRFLQKAAEQTGQRFVNPVHDTLPLARKAWPSLGTYKLSTLAEHIGAAVPPHRALADAKAALAVLLAARKATKRNGTINQVSN